MKLPKISTPKFELTIPSTGEKTEYRPYLAQEEKILMMAKESGKEKDIVRAIKTLIQNCVDKVTDAGKLTTFDMEYIFVKLRAVSVGETASPRMSCASLSGDDSECDEYIPVHINIDNIELVKHEPHTKTIELSDDGIGVILRYPTLDLVSSITGQSETEQTFSTLIYCIESVFDKENTYSVSEADDGEIEQFFYSLSAGQRQKMEERFLNTMPTVEYKTTVKCKKCGKDHDVELKGIQDFF